MSALTPGVEQAPAHVSPMGRAGWLAREGNALLIGAAFLYSVLYAVFWPSIYTTMDEASYMGNAYVLRQGTLYADVADVSVATNFVVPAHGHFVSKYPLGMAALIAALSVFGWKAALGVNLFVHLLTFAVVIRILRFLKLPGAFALLYLLHPTAVLYSRTAMADLASGLVLALAFDAALRGRWGGAGWWAGLSVLLRTGNVLSLPVFFVSAVLATSERFADRVRNGAVLAASAAVPVLTAGYYIVIVAGGLMDDHTGSFGARYFTEMFPAYCVSLLLIYPGLLLAPLLYRGPGKGMIIGVCYSCLLLYSFWFYRDKGSNPVETLIVGQRYFLAVLPLFLVAYAQVVWRLVEGWATKERTRRRAVLGLAVVGAAGLFAVSAGIHWRHARFLGTMTETRNAILHSTTQDDRLYVNMQAGKLLHPAWGKRRMEFGTHGKPASEHAAVLKDWLRDGAGANRRVVLAYWFRNEQTQDRAEFAALESALTGLHREPPAAPLPAGLEIAVFKGTVSAPGRSGINTSDKRSGGSAGPPTNVTAPQRHPSIAERNRIGNHGN
jgi:hypothetical protein